MTMDLNELADRVEALAGPDREVDVLVRDTVFQRCINPGAEYTASIDAAMMLLPDGCRLRALGQGASCVWVVDIADKTTGLSLIIQTARSPAIALTAAALRTKALGAVHTLEGGL